MFDEELDPKTKKPKLRDLSTLSVDELENYIAAMRAEIVRVESEIARKKAHLGAADQLFKKG